MNARAVHGRPRLAGPSAAVPWCLAESLLDTDVLQLPLVPSGYGLPFVGGQVVSAQGCERRRLVGAALDGEAADAKVERLRVQ